MIQHVAIFRWKEGTTDEQVAAVTQALGALPAQIEALRSYTAQPNLALRPGGGDYGVVAVVDDEAGVHAYLDHPAHKHAVDRYIAPIIAERIAVQLPVAG